MPKKLQKDDEKVGKMTEVRVGEMKLTKRQREVCELIVKGFNDEQISKELKITIGTVKQILHLIFRTNGVKSRSELTDKFNEWTRTVKVGDVRENWDKDVFVVSFIGINGNVGVIFRDGECFKISKKDLKSKLLAHYDTWQEAIASKEFNNAG